MTAAPPVIDEDWTEVAEGVILRPMLTVDNAIDLWLADLSRRGRSYRTRDRYRRTLDKFAERFPREWDVAKVTADECEQFLGRFSHLAKGTQGGEFSAIRGFFKWLHRTRRIKNDPMEYVDPPGRTRQEDLDVLTMSTDDVKAMLAAARTWPEKLCLNILAYLGPRRHAVALLRLEDYDRKRQRLRFKEKGTKTIWKPVPTALAELLEAAIADGVISAPDDYLVPSRAQQRRPGDRDDRLIWRLVKNVAARAEVDAHVHALRAAFACFYLESNHNDLYGLQNLMGHESPDTTKIYLRRLDKAQAMEPVRELSWA